LIGGLACDVTGHRAALALAEQLGGVVDHMNGAAQFRNWRVFQDGGWMTTTLSEVRNRADLIVLAGVDIARLVTCFPRFFERCLPPQSQQASQFGDLRRRYVVVGDQPLPTAEHPVDVAFSMPMPNQRLGDFFLALRARLAGRRVHDPVIEGVDLWQVDTLLEALRAARYGVLLWNAADLDFPNADLTIQAMVDLVKDLNQSTRWSGLPLGGSDGDTSAAQVCTWQTGYPLRLAFESGGPRYEPSLFATAALLAAGEVDALVWISAFDPARTPPKANCPTIVLGRADMTFAQPPEVFIPVAVPGVQHAGFLHRMDAVVALPLHAPAPAELLSVARVLAAIQQEISHAAA
jgi:formylmethanofuran dehydrogenase subunit B